MVVVVMGVCGAGKSTVGRLLAAALGFDFAEGDDFHPPANIRKMSAQIPLDDDDRRPWLEAMTAAIRQWRAAGRDVVLACSALKRGYRELLVGHDRGVRLVYLRGTPEVIAARLQARSGHFMPPGLLDSQFAALEEPSPEEGAIAVDVAAAPPEIVARVLQDCSLIAR